MCDGEKKRRKEKHLKKIQTVFMQWQFQANTDSFTFLIARLDVVVVITSHSLYFFAAESEKERTMTTGDCWRRWGGKTAKGIGKYEKNMCTRRWREGSSKTEKWEKKWGKYEKYTIECWKREQLSFCCQDSVASQPAKYLYLWVFRD